MRTETLFTPYVTVAVENGRVVGVDVDWSGTLQNTWLCNAEGQQTDELWNDSQGEEPADTKTAAAFLDNPRVRADVDAAFAAWIRGDC